MFCLPSLPTCLSQGDATYTVWVNGPVESMGSSCCDETPLPGFELPIRRDFTLEPSIIVIAEGTGVGRHQKEDWRQREDGPDKSAGFTIAIAPDDRIKAGMFCRMSRLGISDEGVIKVIDRTRPSHWILEVKTTS